MKSSTVTQRVAALLLFLAGNGAHAELSPITSDLERIQVSQATGIYSQNARGLKRSSRTGDNSKSLMLSENATPQTGDRRGQRPDYTSPPDGAIQAKPRSR